MKQTILLTLLLSFSLVTMAQTRASSSNKTPAGAAYSLSSGATETKTGECLSTTTSDYNVVQVTKGTLNLTDCTVTKEGDYSSSYSGDDTSFYGTNSAVYASGSAASINMSGGSVTTNAKGANAVFATDGATITVSDITIDNSKSVSRGLHCTGGGIINATNVNITTRSETSSTVATDRGGGTVTVKGGTITAKGSKSSVLYSTGKISVDGITGLSEKGPMATVEGANSITIENSQMTSNAEARGILLHQSNSGDAEGTKPVCTVTNSTLTTTNSTAPLCFVTNVTGTLTLTDVTLNVASGMLMSVEYYKRGVNSTGHLVLNTTKDSWTYTGNADADEQNNVAVTVGSNVTWNGAVDPDNNAQSSAVTVESGGVWSLTGNTTLSTLVNNGTIYKNGYTLTAASTSGSGSINEGTTPTQKDCGLAFSAETASAKMGETFTAPVLTNPYSVEVSWSSSDESVATVDASGNVTLVAAGTTVITATFAGNDAYTAGSASYTLTVEKADPVDCGLAFSAETASAKMGETFTAPTLTNPYSVEVSWSSSDESVATVDASGNVTLVAAGTTVITATFAGNDDYKAGAASYTLTVEGEATGISAVDANEGGVEVYSLTGIQMGTFSSAQEARSSLPKGYYVFVEGNREYKVFVR